MIFDEAAVILQWSPYYPSVSLTVVKFSLKLLLVCIFLQVDDNCLDVAEYKSVFTVHEEKFSAGFTWTSIYV